MRVSDFDFDLPESLIATHPCEPRDACRLLHVANDGSLTDRVFHTLPSLLRAGDIVVFNDSKVIPARLFGHKHTGARIEILLHKQIVASPGEWEVFLRPAKRLNLGDIIMIDAELQASLIDKRDGGEATLCFNLTGEDFFAKLQEVGHMPLPPYIRRADEAADACDYQTVYAREAGSVAAPTAGLHFTDALIAQLHEAGIHTAYVTLHVGAGTFQPVKVEDTADHVMHAEYAILSAETANAINTARVAGGRVVAVGTTALRILETVAAEDGTLAPFAGETRIFITPGYRFKLVERLITNFHLPQSTLFMLVCAFSGMETMKSAYEHAKSSGYRFYSYGDACLLERGDSVIGG